VPLRHFFHCAGSIVRPTGSNLHLDAEDATASKSDGDVSFCRALGVCVATSIAMRTDGKPVIKVGSISAPAAISRLIVAVLPAFE